MRVSEATEKKREGADRQFEGKTRNDESYPIMQDLCETLQTLWSGPGIHMCS